MDGTSKDASKDASDTFVISQEDAVDVFVARKRQGHGQGQASGTENHATGLTLEQRGEILSILIQNNEMTSAARSAIFFQAAEMAMGAYSRAIDPPPLGSSGVPFASIPVVTLVRKMYAPAAELRQTVAQGDCRVNSRQEDMPRLLEQLAAKDAGSQPDTQVSARRWELLRRFETMGDGDGRMHRTAVRGTHAEVMLWCGPSTFRAVRLVGPASASTPAEGRALYAGDKVVLRRAEIALVGRKTAQSIASRGRLALVAGPGPWPKPGAGGGTDPLKMLENGAVAAFFASPQAAAAALPPLADLVRTLRVGSVRDALRAVCAR